MPTSFDRLTAGFRTDSEYIALLAEIYEHGEALGPGHALTLLELALEGKIPPFKAAELTPPHLQGVLVRGAQLYLNEERWRDLVTKLLVGLFCQGNREVGLGELDLQPKILVAGERSLQPLWFMVARHLQHHPEDTDPLNILEGAINAYMMRGKTSRPNSKATAVWALYQPLIHQALLPALPDMLRRVMRKFGLRRTAIKLLPEDLNRLKYPPGTQPLSEEETFGFPPDDPLIKQARKEWQRRHPNAEQIHADRLRYIASTNAP